MTRNTILVATVLTSVASGSFAGDFKEILPASYFPSGCKTCRIDIVGDLAGPAKTERCESLCWPVRRECVAFSWQRSKHVQFRQFGDARIDRLGVMELTGGGLKVAAPSKLHTFGDEEFSFDVVFKSYAGAQDGPATIVRFDAGIELAQLGDNLVLRIDSPQLATSRVVVIGKVKAGTWQHALVTYQGGQLTGYLDGREKRIAAVLSSVPRLSTTSIYFGCGLSRQSDWSGSIERVSLQCCHLTRRSALATYLAATAQGE